MPTPQMPSTGVLGIYDAGDDKLEATCSECAHWYEYKLFPGGCRIGRCSFMEDSGILEDEFSLEGTYQILTAANSTCPNGERE